MIINFRTRIINRGLKKNPSRIGGVDKGRKGIDVAIKFRIPLHLHEPSA
jgi:hypothetical protein